VAYDLHHAPLQTMAGTRGCPSRAILALIATKVCNKFKNLKNGANADYIPELAKVPSDLVGAVSSTADGKVYAIGDVDRAFSIQSLSKPFTAALVMQERGYQ